MLNKIVEYQESVKKASNYFNAIFSAKEHLATTRILPTVRIIQNLPALEREIIIDMTRKRLLSSDKDESILAARILSKLQDAEAIPLYLKKLELEKDAYYLVKAMATSLLIIQNQKQVFQNAFHQEGDVYEHSKLVCKSAIRILSFFTDSISEQLSNFPEQIEQEIETILNKIDVQTIPKITASLEQQIDGISRGKLLILCAFLHDIGKPQTATPKLTPNNEFKLFGLKTGYYVEQKFSNHELVGARLFLGEANRIGLSENQTAYIYELIKSHKDITDAVKDARKSGEQRLIILRTSLAEIAAKYKSLDIFHEAILLYLSDSMGKTGELSFANDIDELKEAFFEILNFGF